MAFTLGVLKTLLQDLWYLLSFHYFIFVTNTSHSSRDDIVPLFGCLIGYLYPMLCTMLYEWGIPTETSNQVNIIVTRSYITPFQENLHFTDNISASSTDKGSFQDSDLKYQSQRRRYQKLRAVTHANSWHIQYFMASQFQYLIEISHENLNVYLQSKVGLVERDYFFTN